MEPDAEKTFVKYSRLLDGTFTEKEKETILILSQKPKDINNAVLEKSQLNEKALEKELGPSLNNDVGQQVTKIGNVEGEGTKVQVEFRKKLTMGLSLMFLLIIAGLVTGLLILSSQIQDLKLQNKHMQNDLNSKDQMIQKLELQNQNLTLNLEKFEVAKELVKHFLDKEEHCNREADDSDFKSFIVHKNILHKAAEKGDLKKVALLLELGEDVNGLHKLSPYGSYTALHEAAENGHHEVVELLLQNGASTNITHDGPYFRQHPLNLAAEKGQYKVAEMLIENGADVNAVDETYLQLPPLLYATKNGHLNVVELLLQNGANVNATNHYNETSLHIASKNGYAKIAKLLLRYKIDINASDRYHETAIHIATWKRHNQIVEILVQNGADVDAKNNRQETALHLVSFFGYPETAKLLLCYGADLNLTDWRSFTPLIAAAYEGQDEVVEILIQNGANVDVIEKRFWNATPLYHAAEKGYFKTVETLLKHGAQKDLKSRFNRTALEEAQLSKDDSNSGKTPSQIAKTDYNRVIALLENN